MSRAVGRRAVLVAVAGAPAALLAARVEARDYASAAEVLAEIDRLEAGLDARMAAMAAVARSAEPLARSMRADHERHRRMRADLRRRLGVREGSAPPPSMPAPAAPPTVAGLVALAQDLVHAHAEGLPALRDSDAVDVLARHMVDDARHLAVLQMWAEAEENGG